MIHVAVAEVLEEFSVDKQIKLFDGKLDSGRIL